MEWNPSAIEQRYSPRVGTQGLGIYPLTSSQVATFSKDLWSTTIVEGIADFLFGDMLDSVMGLKWFYGINDHLSRSNLEYYVTLGQQAFKGEFGTGQSIATKIVDHDYVHIDCGYVTIPQVYNDFRDLEPYTRLEVYIPFLGMVQLNAADFISTDPYNGTGAASVNYKLHLEYTLNIVTGAAVAFISRHRAGVFVDGVWRPSNSDKQVVHMAQCQMGVDVPLNINSKEDLLNRMTQGLTGLGLVAGASAVGPLFAAGAAGVAGAGVTSQVAAGMGANQGMMSGMGNAISSTIQAGGGGGAARVGSLAPEMATLSSFRPMVRITRKIGVEFDGLREIVGRPDVSVINISEASGYIKVAGLANDSFADPQIPKSAMDEIINIMKGGVYV